MLDKCVKARFKFVWVNKDLWRNITVPVKAVFITHARNSWAQLETLNAWMLAQLVYLLSSCANMGLCEADFHYYWIKVCTGWQHMSHTEGRNVKPLDIDFQNEKQQIYFQNDEKQMVVKLRGRKWQVSLHCLPFTTCKRNFHFPDFR